MPRGRRGAAASLPLFGFPAATGTRLHPDELSGLSARRQEVSRAACVTRGAPLRSLPWASSCNNRRVACETPCERIFPDAGCHSRVVLAFPGCGVHLSVKFILVLFLAVGAQHWHESVGDACHKVEALVFWLACFLAKPLIPHSHDEEGTYKHLTAPGRRHLAANVGRSFDSH
ncbi:hypothetical protein IscW_ISCW017480 [Ixodes scapularis]|uniref:Uncharacterized protein n=1 Tax=Ixodes scapularis TaxID=6945 RepID=B7P878_IXOSC|nr:hypothetical protein IscW_ISCW017480 [Ixodes scapularis]|eukprot:XP_002401571.1 hypothetical protein IscW_ISCW017480 [Ixodes scapularis]